MAITPTSASETEFSVSATLPATNDQAGFEALTFTKVGGAATIGEMGEGNEEQTYDTFDGQIKYEGIRTASSISDMIVDDPADAGQVILQTAADAAAGSAGRRVAVKVSSGGGAMVDYGVYTTLSFKRNRGGTNDLVKRQLNMSAIVGTHVQVNT